MTKKQECETETAECLKGVGAPYSSHLHCLNTAKVLLAGKNEAKSEDENTPEELN